MYRNWSARIAAGPSLGRYISGTCRVGWLGADILAATSNGAFGAGIFVNDQVDPIKRYRALLEASTFPAGALELRERGDGSFSTSGTAVFGIFENNTRLGSTAFSGVIGPAAGPLAGAGSVQTPSSPAAAVIQTHVLAGLNGVSVALSTTGAAGVTHNLAGSACVQAAQSPGRAILGVLPRGRIPGRLVSAPARRLVVAAAGQTIGGRIVPRIAQFSAKAPTEVIGLQFDFARLTAEPILPVVTVTQLSGPADPNPQAMVLAPATLAGEGLVDIVVGAGVLGADYMVTCQVDTAAGRRFVLSAVLPVRAG